MRFLKGSNVIYTGNVSFNKEQISISSLILFKISDDYEHNITSDYSKKKISYEGP